MAGAVTVARARNIGIVAVSAVSLAAGSARADDAASALPIPRLVPDLRLDAKDQAQEPPRSAASSWAARPRTISLMGGSGGGPVGYGGIGLEYAPVPWLVGGAAAGWSPSGPTGALMPRLRLPITRWLAAGFGVPFSAGPYEYVFDQPERCALAGCSVGVKTARTWSIAYWGHVEPNVELRVGGGLALRTYAGYGKVLNANDDRCTSTQKDGCPSRLGEQVWYGGLALGYAW
jgi:hypothetical protein